MNKTIKKAIEHCGGQNTLAKLCNTSQQTVSKWLNGGGINAKYIPLIAKATDGKVTETAILQSLTKS